MRTTNRKIKDQIQNHILGALGEGMTLSDVVDRFHKEKYSHPNEIKYYKGNKHAAFKDWMLGLPSSFNVEYTNEGIHTALKTWFENACENEYRPSKTIEESDLYFHLVTREFDTLCKKNNIKEW